jgi:hypothetical protein
LALCTLASLSVTACALDSRKFAPAVDQTQGTDDAGPGNVPAPEGSGGQGGDVVPPSPPGQEGPPDIGGVLPGDTTGGGAGLNASCDAGPCLAAGDAGSSGACVPTGPRDCTSGLDNDCDGQADDVLDDVCICAPGSVEPCEAHPGLDGRGQCTAGERICAAGAGNLTSDWGACEGSVGPGEADSCAVIGDDTDCDGIVNGGCPCIDGETRPCGPESDLGICEFGVQTCEGGSFGDTCVGAVFPAARDCGSSGDNDCDGEPDDTIDAVCRCEIGAVQACETHPGRDGNGPCRAGSQTCAGLANDSSSEFGDCIGSVGPEFQDTCDPGDDSDCNGLPNEGCACVNGQDRACGPDTELGVCQRGTQTCFDGVFGACQGAVFSGSRDCDSPLDNDCDGRPDNTFDDVCLPPQNPFACSVANPPAAVLAFSLFPTDPDTGGVSFPPGAPPAASGGTVQDGSYAPVRMDVYGQADAPAFAVNELTFEFRDGFVEVGYHAYIGTGAVLGSGELAFVGTATPVGNSLQFDVDRCDPEDPCTAGGGITCTVPASLPYSATANGLVVIQASTFDDTTVVTTYALQ